MKTVKDVSEIAGVSIRTLRHYDEIGLLKPTELTEAGYRLYGDKALEKLQEIMFYRELEIPLSEIKTICECGKKAIVNARIDENGRIITSGGQIMLGGNDSYIAMCHACWKKKIKDQEEN